MSLRDRLAAANAAAREVADEGRADRQPRSGHQPQQGATAPAYPPPPAAPVHKRRRRWPWIVGGIVALLLIIGLADGGDESPPSPGTPALNHRWQARAR